MDGKIDICYLCGQKLDENIDHDHIPPKQFYASNIRKFHNLNLFTLPAHKSCNKSYQKDEDYSVHSLAPLALGSYSGNAIWVDIANQFERPQGKRIGQMILKEFEKSPSGIILPNGKIAKRFNSKRIYRVLWKITRGLFFKEKGEFLPENTPRRYFKITPLDEKPPPEFIYVANTPSRGKYRIVFDYKYINFPKLNNLHLWAMLFWNKLVTLIEFQYPKCTSNKFKNYINMKSKF